MFLFVSFQLGLYLENYFSLVNGPRVENSRRSALGRWTSSFLAAEEAEKETLMSCSASSLAFSGVLFFQCMLNAEHLFLIRAAVGP